jgi:hypothetical protein
MRPVFIAFRLFVIPAAAFRAEETLALIGLDLMLTDKPNARPRGITECHRRALSDFHEQRRRGELPPKPTFTLAR